MKFLAHDDFHGVFITYRIMKYPLLSLQSKVVWAIIAETQEHPDYKLDPKEISQNTCLTENEINKALSELLSKDFAAILEDGQPHLHRHPLFDEERAPMSVTIQGDI